jgi:hypothetical protein
MPKQKPKPLTLKSLKADIETVAAQQDIHQQEQVELEERVYILEHPCQFFAPIDTEPEIPGDAAELDPIPAQVLQLDTSGGFAWLEFTIGVVVGLLIWAVTSWWR